MKLLCSKNREKLTCFGNVQKGAPKGVSGYTTLNKYGTAGKEEALADKQPAKFKVKWK